jgi:hypothetical protein
MGYRRGVTEILWGPYQEHHIAVRHGVTAELFEAAWVDRSIWSSGAMAPMKALVPRTMGARYT